MEIPCYLVSKAVEKNVGQGERHNRGNQGLEQPLGTYGSISVWKLEAKYAATTRYRRIQATATSSED